MERNAVSLRTRDGFELRSFPNVMAAILYMDGRSELSGCAPAIAASDLEICDRLAMIALSARNSLRKTCRHAQFDALLRGDIRALPQLEWEGLQKPIAATLGEALAQGGWLGWEVEEGTIDTRRGPVDHAWLRHQDGTALDIAAELIGGPVLRICPPRSEDLDIYEGGRPVSAIDLLRVDPDDLAELAQTIADWSLTPQLEAEPDFAP